MDRGYDSRSSLLFSNGILPVAPGYSMKVARGFWFVVTSSSSQSKDLVLFADTGANLCAALLAEFRLGTLD